MLSRLLRLPFVTVILAPIVGATGVVAGAGCTSSEPPSDHEPPPPSPTAAPWVGCYVCDSTLTATPHLPWIDASTFSVHLSSGLGVTASGAVLTGQIGELLPEGGRATMCSMRATVTAPGKATLDALDAGCEISTAGSACDS
jgi:hypothetical protein